MYKIIFADIDGTLRNSKREISQRTKDDIEKLKKMGIEVIMCSGRPRCEVERVSRECNASRYIISSNGAEVYNYITKKVEYRNMVGINAIVKLYEIAQREDCIFVMNTGNIRIVNKYKYKDHTEIIPSEGIIKSAYDNNIMQCIIIDKDFEKMKRVREEILKVEGIRIINESKCFNNKSIIPTDSIYCDIVDQDTSKGVAVERVCEILNVKKEETIGIGDSYNDLELLEHVGYSVAMKNAVRGLKSKVDEVTNSNDLDGAAEFFEKIINGKIK
jgi:Cof subfamily protein (haloacid dehalogenase superfamily)